MTIDEWIEYAEKRQKDHEYHSRSCRDDKSWVKHQKEWANEYRQLAEWLKELKMWREAKIVQTATDNTETLIFNKENYE